MSRCFRELDRFNTGIAQQAQNLIETQNKALAERIQNAGERLMRQVLAASALAVSLALAFGVWLARSYTPGLALPIVGFTALSVLFFLALPAVASWLKRPLDTFKYLQLSIETGEVSLTQQNVLLNCVMLASANEVHLDAFREHPEFASFRGRIELIRTGYLLSAANEKHGRGQLFAGGETGGC